MSLGLVGRKVGMTRVFTDDGDSVPVTVVDVSDNRVDPDQDSRKPTATPPCRSRSASAARRRVNKAAAGHFAKAAVEAGPCCGSSASLPSSSAS